MNILARLLNLGAYSALLFAGSQTRFDIALMSHPETRGAINAVMSIGLLGILFEMCR